MSILDLRSVPPGTRFDADLALVGAGPAGLTLAREFAHTRLKILLVESGGVEFDPEVQLLNRVENIGDPKTRNAMPLQRGYTGDLAWLNDIPAFELRNRIVGGSTHTWIGKCAAFDELDFDARQWVPDSGWPLQRRDLMDVLDRAANLLNLGPNIYDKALYRRLKSPPADIDLNDNLLRTFFWQFSHKPKSSEPLRFGELAAGLEAVNVDVLTHASVTRIGLCESGRKVETLNVKSLSGVDAVIRAPAIVLCGGGIENARMLLASTDVAAKGIGNDHDCVGRYLADHPRTVIARFGKDTLQDVTEQFGFYGLSHNRRTHFYLRGLALSPRLQMREGLLNCATYPVQVLAPNDPWLALKRFYSGSRRFRLDDLRTALAAPGGLAAGLHSRLVMKRGLPRQLTELRFDAMAEQRPNRESRLTLSSQRDRLGVPLARVDWRIGWAEAASLARLAELISAEFWRVGLPQPKLEPWVLDEDFKNAPFSDMAHPACTTRMGHDPKTSVVDPNAKIHGIDGLYVAGSSVFPTPGHANPTLMIIAMTLRLADHLKTRLLA
ncbi:GMC oxidoreductase [Nitratireductor kimnyeongensis]|uniref:GMC oxidoreductase n=1 Tax=Nitratireductor kimnyeongensis TaxID=430679 RepID=A0ABW0T486_9HYPH|nr:GMC family oxidoreductase [Nitratireductor kimnyeongensis]QZZ34842.1 GMC family oxidoreductase [Nitratireductor kimnyeongensis]